MARRAQHLRCSLSERSERADNKLDNILCFYGLGFLLTLPIAVAGRVRVRARSDFWLATHLSPRALISFASLRQIEDLRIDVVNQVRFVKLLGYGFVVREPERKVT